MIGAGLTRREAVAAAAAALASAIATSASAGLPPAPAREVVIYCSADSVYARPILAEFTKRTGIKVLAVYDAEATKTTGLVQRLINEHGRGGGVGGADVWWSSEPLGTIRLARAGVLKPHTSAAAEAAMKPHGGWLSGLRGKDGMWYGFGCRARVFVYNSKHIPAGEAPAAPVDLLRPTLKGRIGIARPQFGTTRGHMAAILTHSGADALREWLSALRKNGLNLFDGNSSVVRAVATGEVYAGLTDTDDVYAGQREGWPVALSFEAALPDSKRGFQERLPPMGPMLVPNTLAMVANGAHPAEASELFDFLLSTDAQRLLAESDSHNLPVDPDLAKNFEKFRVPSPASLDLEAVADRVEEAMRICDDVLG